VLAAKAFDGDLIAASLDRTFHQYGNVTDLRHIGNNSVTSKPALPVMEEAEAGWSSCRRGDSDQSAHNVVAPKFKAPIFVPSPTLRTVAAPPHLVVNRLSKLRR
jgi:hypothetical protein